MSENELEDITPDESVAPVYLDPTPGVPTEPPVIEDQAPARTAGIAKLMALGLTEGEAKAVAGASP